ncbi:hypothetical protein [Arenimonas oryziterrae]|uniref:Outer membrane protein beta-barrel domain-containing protein n=1 Tax=Arenimonas oryziterrae DSM 21050 = YC6267 TaxID=1121015 RepID=A0A091AQ55_9GAMM|nr:hypothetical protein [Arenimonas oryziterrae]KFN41139.1 hypothetical protein N789_04435 [Arenimonas oryziterrae DSM 21050 = YC6267]
MKTATQKNAIRRLQLASAVGLSLLASTAMAGPKFYGSVEFGRLSSNSGGDVVFSYDNGQPSFPVSRTDLGDGNIRNLKLGFQLSSPLFIEFSQTNSHLDQSAISGPGVANTAGPCDISPTLGLFNDCFNRAEITRRYTSRNQDLIAGWNFDLTPAIKLSPYAGMRRMKYNERRLVEYRYIPGFNDSVTDFTSFSDIGWVAGARYEQNFTHFFISGELQYAHASDDRTRGIRDHRFHMNDGATVDDAEVFITERRGVNNRMFRLGIGKRFLFGGQQAKVTLGYQEAYANGLDTRITNNNDYAPNALGSNNASAKARGIFVNFGINN